MFLSYLITCHNEDQCLDKLLTLLVNNLKDNHEIVVLDDYSDNPYTIEILNRHKDKISLHQRKLENHYGEQKNYGIEQCSGEWIFQIDADEYPTQGLLDNIDIILKSNDQNEVLWIPRLNMFHGVTDDDVRHWGWKLHEGYVNFPDYQSRLFRRLPHIRYLRRLHEKVEGHKSYAFIPPQKEFALFHEKSIEKQRETNLRYNKDFTEKENKGYSVK